MEVPFYRSIVFASCAANLLLCHGCPDVDFERRGGRHVGGDEWNRAFHQPGNEMNVAGQTVKAGNQKHGTAAAAFFEGGVKLRAGGVALPALHFGICTGKLAAADEEPGNS